MNAVNKTRRRFLNQQSVCAILCLFAMLPNGCRQLGNSVATTEKSSNQLSDEAAVDIQFALARSLEQKGDTEQAIWAYQKLADKGVPVAMHRLGILYDQKEQFAEAERNYQKAIKLNPGDAELWCDLGYSYYLQEKWDASESHLRKAIQIDPQMERGHNNLGLTLARLDQRHEALAAFKRAATDSKTALANFNYVFNENEVTPVVFNTTSTISDSAAVTNVSPTRIGTSKRSDTIDDALGITGNLPPAYVVQPLNQSEFAEKFAEYFKDTGVTAKDAEANQGE